jgi:hypothetical protein
MGNAIFQQALSLLEKKGIITKQELLEERKRLKGQK